MKGRSCLTNLLETFQEVTSKMDEGGSVVIVYFDYSKGIRLRPSQKIAFKAYKSYEIEETVWSWVENILIGRNQMVTVGNAESEWTDVASGVPQGSVLGPILFVIYINGLPENVKSSVKMLTEDTKLYRYVISEEDRDELQKNLNALQKWFETWLFSYNASKCKRMHMGHSNNGTNYQLGGETKPHDSQEKALGVIISEHCRTSKQCIAAPNKEMGKLRVIKRTFKYFNTDCFAILYKTYIRPY